MNKNPSVVFVASPLSTFTAINSGALATIMWECCQVATKQGIETAVIARNSSTAPFANAKSLLVEYPSIPDNPLAVAWYRAERKITGWVHMRQQAYAIRMIQTIKRASLDQSHFVILNHPEIAVLMRRHFPNAFIAHWFQNQLECKPRFRQAFGSSVDITLGVSDFTRAWLRDYYALPENRLFTLYNAVDSNTFSPAHKRPEGNPIINFVGRTGIEKAPDTLLSAALRLAKKTDKFGLQLVGSNYWDKFEEDDFQRKLSGLANELEKMNIVVSRPGHIGRAELPNWFRKAHIHVVPSRWDEPFGLTTVEGMASGLATVASRTGGSPEVIGESGLLFERDNEEELAEHLYGLVTSKERLQNYGCLARKRAMEFTWENTWNKLRTYLNV